MGVVGEAKVIISADDRTGDAFKSLERKVQGLGKATKSVGEAAGSVGKIAGEVDKVSGAVARSSEAVSRFSGVLKTVDGAAAGIGQVAASVERAAATMPRLTADAGNMAKAMQGVAAAERAVASETDRISRAGSKLSLFKTLQGDFKAARATFDAAKSELASLAKLVEQNDRRATALRRRRDDAVAAEAKAKAAYDANPVPRRADAADADRFNAMLAARAQAAQVMTAATKERRELDAALGIAETGTEARKLARNYQDAQKVTSLASTALEAQRSMLKGVKAEFEGLAGPLVSLSGAEKRLVADAEAATRAFEAQTRAAGVLAEATAAALAREEAAFARAAAGRARWAREFAALDGHAAGQRGALAPRRPTTAVEALATAMRRPAHEPPHSAAAREVEALTDAKMRLKVFREMQESAAALRTAARQAQAEAAKIGREVHASAAPSPELLAAQAEARGHASAATRAFEAQSGALKGLKAEIEQVLGPMHSLASAESQIASRAGNAETTLRRQGVVHRRLHAVKGAAEDLLPFEGPEILHLTREMIVEGAKVQHERVGLVNAGRTPEEVEAIERRSREVSARLPTATAEENLKVIAETTGAFGSLDHALEHLQFMQQTMSILHTAAGDKMHEGPGEVGRYLAKFFEDRQTKPEEFERQAKSLIPAMVATGGVFNPREMYMFALQAKSSLPNYDNEFLSRYMPALVARSDGEKTGTAANAFTNTITGKARDAKQAAAWLNLGLLDPKLLTPGTKGPVGWQAGAVKGTDLALANPVRWAEEVLIPAMKTHGINTDDRMAVTKELATMFRNNTANFFANEISQAVSLALLHKDAGLYSKVGEDDDIYKRNLHEDPTVALSALGDAIKTFAGDVTSPIMKDVASVLGSTAQSIAQLGKGIADFDAAHPEIAKAIAGGAIGAVGGTGLALTGMLYTNLKSLLSGGATTAAAAEMTAAGGMQVEAGRLMLAAAGKGDLPGGGTPNSPVKEVEKAAAKVAPGLPLLTGGAVPAIVAGTILAGGAAAGAERASAVDDYGRVNGNWGDDPDHPFGFKEGNAMLRHRKAHSRRGILARTWGWMTGNTPRVPPHLAGIVPVSPPPADVPLPPVRPAGSSHRAPSLLPVSLTGVPAGALPPALPVTGVPVPVTIISAPPAALPPPIPDRWLDGGRPAIERASAIAADHFRAQPEAARGEALASHTESLAGLLSGLKATIDGPVMATVTGSAEIAVTVKVEPGSALLQAAATASSGRAALPLTSTGSTGGVGTQRTSANPQYGANGGAGRGPR